MNILPAEDDSRQYPELIDRFTLHRNRFGDTKSAVQLKTYMLDVLAHCETSIADVGQHAIWAATQTDVGTSSEPQSAAVEASWEFLKQNGLEFDFLDQRALGIRAALCVTALNMQTQSINDVIFWFFKFIDGLDNGCAARASTIFEKHFSSPAAEGHP